MLRVSSLVDRFASLAQTQWAPTLTAHTPNPPLPVETGAFSADPIALATQTATIAGTGTHTAPTYTGSGAVSTQTTTTAGSGTHAAPVYAGTGTPSAQVATTAGSGT